VVPGHIGGAPGRTAGVKASDVRVGFTYQVHVPRGDDPLRHAASDPGIGEQLAWLAIHRGDFDLTVTAAAQLDEPAVTGIMVVTSAQVTVPLPVGHAAALGLGPGVSYVVEGRVCDAATGRAVELPQAREMTVPVRWLSPPGT
jgi:hypothetical protein